MSWSTSLFIALLSGLLGLCCAGGISLLCVEWYRVSSFEGKSGYFVVVTALLGGLAAFVIGLVAARWIASGATPGFLSGLGAACAVVLGVALIALVLCRLLADIAPTIDGKSLEVEVELRAPKDFQLPEADEYGATIEVYVSGGRRQYLTKLRVAEGDAGNDELVLTASPALTTSSSQKLLYVRFNAANTLMFELPLRARPHSGDLEWSPWRESGWDPSKPERANVAMRYRVRVVEPPPPAPSEEEQIHTTFTALSPDAPLAAWLPYLFQRPNAERTRVVIEHINAQQSELADLIRSDDATMREHALEAVKYVEAPTQALGDGVLAEGRAISEAIVQLHALAESDPEFAYAPIELSSRFNHWKHAWWALHPRLGLDGRAPVQQILEAASAGANSARTREIAVNARAIVDALSGAAQERQP